MNRCPPGTRWPASAPPSTSPDNLSLRAHLVEPLVGLGRLDEAEQEYRAALACCPDQLPLKVGLARTYHQQGKHGPALVGVEDLRRPTPLRPPSQPRRDVDRVMGQ